MTSEQVPPRSLYARRQVEFTAQAAVARQRRDRLSRWRLLVFLVIVGGVVVAMGDTTPGAAAWAAVFGSLAMFVFLVIRQRGAEGERSRSAELARINAEALARTERSWKMLPVADFPKSSSPPPPRTSQKLPAGDLPPPHPAGRPSSISRDLDLFGQGSLFQLLGTPATSGGRRMLAAWLLDPAPPATIRARQAAVRELGPQLGLRQEVERQARRTAESGKQMESFLHWSASGGWLQRQRWPLLAARVLTVLLGILVAAHMAGLLPPIWIGLLPINGIVWLLGVARISGELSGIDLRADALKGYSELLRVLEETPFQSVHLQQLQTVVRSGGVPAHRWTARLQRIVELAEVRNSPMIYIPLQLATLWDTHVLSLLDQWRSDAGEHAGEWIDAVSELEALIALGGLSHDQPDWIFPNVDPEVSSWTAEGIGHPLLRDEDRVLNDVRLGPPGTFLLVTGSNMSGKSTLLRSIGTNIILAQAGGPVCATRFTLPPTRLGTSFVIEDSLESGVSFFLAELQRLKEVIDQSALDDSAPAPRFLFLLDEILKGTNSGERQIAVRGILRELLENGAAGAITSHDLALADVPELQQRSVAVHFREHFSRRDGLPRMEFDHLLRDGVATTSNALALLELVGIGRPSTRGTPRSSPPRTR